jgi:addiction module RelE/StbE family toxin
MKLEYHRSFLKQFRKLDRKTREKFKKQIRIFEKDPFRKPLNNHSLKGKYLGYHSINITGDMRAIFKITEKGECVFLEIGSHSELYS